MILPSRLLFQLLASLSTSVLALPVDANSPPAIHEHQDSREIRSLSSLTLENSSLTEVANLTIPTINLPGFNASSNSDPKVFCHQDTQPPIFGHVDIVECGILILAMLADDSPDLHASQWNSVYPVRLPWISGLPKCQLRVLAVSPESWDVFPRAMVAQRLALIVSSCPDNKGGVVSLGPRADFQVQVSGSSRQASVV